MKYCNKCEKYQTAVNTDSRCYKCYGLCVEKEIKTFQEAYKHDIQMDREGRNDLQILVKSI